MQLFTLLSSFIIVAGARPVPQTAPVGNSTGLPTLNSSTTISVQDALSILSAGSAPSATSVSVLASAAASAALTSAAAAASSAATGSADAANTTVSLSLNSTDSATSVLSTDFPTATTTTDDGSDGNSTDTSTPDLSSLSALPTASLDNSTDTVTAVASSSTATNVGASYALPTDIPQACIAKVTSNVSASNVITASIADSTGLSSVSLDAGLSGIDTSTLTASAVNASTTDSSFVSVNVTATAVASASATSVPLASGSVSASAASISTSLSTIGTGATSPSVTVATAASSAVASSSAVSPLQLVKRIAQDDLPDVAQSWQDLCLASGGDIFTNEPCVTLAGVNGINALLADADPCDQQDNADAMIDFAKSTGVTNSADLIANAIAYRQHPRNAFSVNGVIPSTPYCQKAPKNDELKGIVNAQLPGVSSGVYGGPSFGLVAFGDPSSCPFGTSPNVDSCGCS